MQVFIFRIIKSKRLRLKGKTGILEGTAVPLAPPAASLGTLLSRCRKEKISSKTKAFYILLCVFQQVNTNIPSSLITYAAG